MTTDLPSRKDFLKTLKLVKIADLPDDTNVCGICLGGLADNAQPGNSESERAVHLHSSHFYGEDCIRRWLEEHDSCPHCREKVHGGTEEDIHVQHRLLCDLRTETQQMMRRNPNIDCPIIDHDLLNLLGRLRSAIHAVTSGYFRYVLEGLSCSLIKWRTTLWKRDPACLQLCEIAPYTRSTVLDTEDVDTILVVRAEQIESMTLEVIDAGYTQSIQATSVGEPVHKATHPLSFSVSRAVRRQLRFEYGKTMLISRLAARLRNAVERDPRNDFPKGLKDFCDDLIARVLKELIQKQ